MLRMAVLAVLVACGGSGPQPPSSDDAVPPAPPGPVIIFSRTQGFRHVDAIAACKATLPAPLAAIGLTSIVTEDPAVFHDLSTASAVLFAYTSGNNVLDAEGKAELERFVRSGGGWAGIHSAADTEYQWPFYQEMIVSHFLNHPAPQPATMDIVDRTNPATAVLPDGRWTATDEWYNFATNPRGDGVTILATIDETSYTGGVMMGDHPMIWAHERLGGRVIYSEPGHAAARWSEPAYVDHVVGAIRWVARVAE